MKTRDKTTWILKTIYQVRERGEAGCPSDNFAPLRLECGEKGLSCVPETGEEGWGAISRVMLLFFFVRPAVLKVAKGCSFFFNLSPPQLSSHSSWFGGTMETLLHGFCGLPFLSQTACVYKWMALSPNTSFVQRAVKKPVLCSFPCQCVHWRFSVPF